MKLKPKGSTTKECPGEVKEILNGKFIQKLIVGKPLFYDWTMVLFQLKMRRILASRVSAMLVL